MISDFRAIVATHQAQTFAVAFRVLRNREDALDVLQESFLELFRHLTSVPAEQAGAWLARVATNRALDRLRRRARERALEVPAEATLSRAPEAYLVAEEQRAAVAAALDQISPQQHAVVTRRIFEGLSFAAIARELGLAEGSVKVHFRRALTALHALLGREKSPT